MIIPAVTAYDSSNSCNDKVLVIIPEVLRIRSGQLQHYRADSRLIRTRMIYFLRSWCLMARKGTENPLPKKRMK